MTTPSDLIEEVARAIMESNMRDTHLRLHKKGETWIFPADAWPKMVEENWNDAEVRGEALNSARAAASIIIEACAKVAEERGVSSCERGIDDPSTGAFECRRLDSGECFCSDADEIAEGIRALVTAKPEVDEK